MLKLNSPLSSSLLFLLGLASLGVAVAFFYNAASLINTFVTALIIALTVSPIMFALKRRGAPTWAAYTATVSVLLAILVIFVLIVVGAGQQFLGALPDYFARSESAQASMESALDTWGVESLGLDAGAMAGLFNPSAILDLTGKFVSEVVDTFSDLVLIAILILFLLVDALSVPAKMASYLEGENPIILRLKRYTVLVRRYIGITTLVGLVTGVLDTLLFSVVGVEFALLWGIVAFLFSFVPAIGFWIALIPPVTLAYLQFGFPAALLVFFGIVVINGFAENIVKPRYMGIGLNLSFFMVFFSVVVWSAILGSMGAILAIPLTLAFKVLVLEGDEAAKWFFDLISDKKRPASSANPDSE